MEGLFLSTLNWHPLADLFAEIIKKGIVTLVDNARDAIVDVELYVSVYRIYNIFTTPIYNAHLMVEGLNNGAVLHKVCGTIVLIFDNNIAVLILKAYAHI